MGHGKPWTFVEYYEKLQVRKNAFRPLMKLEW